MKERVGLTEESRRYRGLARAWAVALLVTGIVCLARAALIATFGSSLPFWDQWGAEATGIYKPILKGSYHWKHLCTAHNEHRIGLTRLFAIGLFYLNDFQWDARVQSLANSLIMAASAGLFAFYLQRRTGSEPSTLLCLLLVLIGSLPFGWENTVAGFQSSFYFLSLLTLLMLWASAHLKTSPGAFVLVTVLSVLTVFTLATGVITMAACLGILALRVICRRESIRGILWLAVPLLLVLAVALLNQPRVDYHDALKAKGLVEYLRAALITTSWPLVPPAILLFAAPVAVSLLQTLRYRTYEPVDAFFAGLFAWAALIGLATAYARGRGMETVPSRYTDLLALGTVAHVHFAFRLPAARSTLGRRAAKALSLGVPTLVVAGLVGQSILCLSPMKERLFLTRIEAVNVRAFLEGDAMALQDKPRLYIPHPDAALLSGALSDPTIQAILPVSVHPKGVAGPIATTCVWRPRRGDSRPPIEGTIKCSGDRTPPTRTAGIGVGKLSVVAYGLWKLLAVDALPRFEPVSTRVPVASTDFRCAIDLVNGQKPPAGNVFTVSYPSVIRFAGWAGPLRARPLLRALRLSLVSESGEHFTVFTKERMKRPDVTNALGDGGLLWSGFDFAASGVALPRGRYRILVADHDPSPCDTGHFLAVNQASDDRLTY